MDYLVFVLNWLAADRNSIPTSVFCLLAFSFMHRHPPKNFRGDKAPLIFFLAAGGVLKLSSAGGGQKHAAHFQWKG